MWGHRDDKICISERLLGGCERGWLWVFKSKAKDQTGHEGHQARGTVLAS